MGSEGSGPWGPVIGVLFAIAALTAASVAFSHFCVGRAAFLRTGYNVEAMVERKCGTCIDVEVVEATTPVKKRSNSAGGEGAEEVEEVEASEPPQEEEEEEGGTCR
ncbi:hypothetical protein ACP70R_035401 [Stipagrostis hirtigluma subsp. patula]